MTTITSSGLGDWIFRQGRVIPGTSLTNTEGNIFQRYYSFGGGQDEVSEKFKQVVKGQAPWNREYIVRHDLITKT
jgi:hypothetical protein